MRNSPTVGAACEGHINFHPSSSGGATTHSTIKGKVGIVNIIKRKKWEKKNETWIESWVCECLARKSVSLALFPPILVCPNSLSVFWHFRAGGGGTLGQSTWVLKSGQCVNCFGHVVSRLKRRWDLIEVKVLKISALSELRKLPFLFFHL